METLGAVFQLLWLQQCKMASVQVTKEHIYRERKYQSTEYEGTGEDRGLPFMTTLLLRGQTTQAAFFVFSIPTTTVTTQRTKGEISAFHFPNVSHLTFNCGCADFVAPWQNLVLPTVQLK